MMPPILAHLVNVLSFAIVLLLVAVVGLLAMLALMRVVLARRERKYDARKERVRPLVMDLMTADGSPEEAAWKLDHLVASRDKKALEQVLLANGRIVKGPEKEMLTYVFEALGFVDEDIENVTRGSDMKKAESAFHLGVMKSARSVPYLLRELRSSNQAVVFASLNALSHIGTPEAISGVMDFMTSDHKLRSSRVAEVLLEKKREFAPLIRERLVIGEARGELLWLLIDVAGAMRDTEAVPVLIAYLDGAGPDAMTVSKAARALGSIGDQAACAPLTNALRDGSPLVRAAAAEALGHLACKDAIGALTGAIHDVDLNVKVNVAFALTKLGPRGYEALTASLSVGEASVAEALGTAAVRSGVPLGVDPR
ncbi:MAG TPA: HEAT repeat domain-containing protein [Candidatus Anoxymicrobiaceae bacterium]